VATFNRRFLLADRLVEIEVLGLLCRLEMEITLTSPLGHQSIYLQYNQ
jgi:hypothetical protein